MLKTNLKTAECGLIGSFLRVTITICAAQFITGTAIADQVKYKIRNDINAGDESFNVIASSGAEVVIYLDPNGSLRSEPRDEVLSDIRSHNSNILAHAVSRSEGEPMSVAEDLAIADFAFASGRYSSAAVLYSRVLDEIRANPSLSKEVMGLITASFYGSQRHLEGLRFICARYQGLPRQDARYRHEIHAHLRSLAVNLGHYQAEKILDAVRRDPKCRRSDFSPIWIPIHLHDMRDLENSVSPLHGVYGISIPDDLEYARNLIKRNDVGFKDYLLFVLGKFEEVVQNYPNSYVYDLALIGAGDKAKYDDAIRYLDEYYNRFGTHKLLTRQVLFRRALNARDYRKVNDLLGQFGDEAIVGGDGNGVLFFQIDAKTRVWFKEGMVESLTLEQLGLVTEFYQECRSIEAAIVTSQFPHTIRQLARYGERYKKVFDEEIAMQGWYGNERQLDYNDTCAFELSGEQLIEFADILMPLAERVDGGIFAEVESAAYQLKRCADFRQGLRLADHVGTEDPPAGMCKKIVSFYNEIDNPDDESLSNGAWMRFSMHDLSAALLIDLFNSDFFEAENALFVRALSYRNKRDYQKFSAALTEFIALYPESDLIDDALAELGWYNLAVTENIAQAQSYFETVVQDHSGKNAYDNALNWLVILHRQEGNLVQAAYWSAILVQDIVSTRLLAKIGNRDAQLQAIIGAQRANPSVVFAERNTTPDPYGKDYTDFFGSGSGSFGKTLYVRSVSDPSLGLRIGDQINSLNGDSINSTLGFHEKIAALAHQGADGVWLSGYSQNNPNLPQGIFIPISAFGF
jgi:tetratricopeptide (TPR) repeat protein